MKITDTLASEPFEVPRDHVRIYLCGVTVYDESHIGHARTIIVFDVLRRYLEETGCQVTLVQNFTDIDDKIIDRADREAEPASSIAGRYIENYHRDFDALHVKRASLYPQATQHMAGIIRLVEDLVQKGVAYAGRNGVYFAVDRFARYGKLSNKVTGDLLAGARVQVDPDKKNPLDFALWKFSDSEPRWPSPWGPGRPGWHIECSAMCLEHLGSGFDIHGGGRDLIFPHHENEIAQSEAHTGTEFAKSWMHVGMVTIHGEKMSKSLGNIKSVRHVLYHWGPNVIRLFCLSGHYSKPIDYSGDLLQESLVKWRQIESAHYNLIHAQYCGDLRQPISEEYRGSFDASLDDDLNTHDALGAFLRFTREINQMASDERLGRDAADAAAPQMKYFLDVLGLYIPPITQEEIKSINDMILRRHLLRESKEYAQADTLRDQLTDMNIELLDHVSGTSWIKKEVIKSDLPV